MTQRRVAAATVARALYERPPDERELRAIGLSLDDFDGDAIEVWPEHQTALRLFSRMATQWRTGMNGPTGLDYVVLLSLMDRLGLDAESFDDLLDDVRVMEAEAMKVMRA